MLVEGLLNGTRISAVLNVVDQIQICNRGAGAARKEAIIYRARVYTLSMHGGMKWP